MEVRQNPLGSAPLGKLLVKFAVPSIISMLVSALYNIVDQIFIGQGVGMYGNAATNVAFPLTTLATAVGLMLGIGGASDRQLWQVLSAEMQHLLPHFHTSQRPDR